VKRTLDSLGRRARELRTEIYALSLAWRDPRVPWYGKALAVCVVGYALSPIDLIPDFVPLLGYLDDLIIVPLGIALALKTVPPEVMAECRERARLSEATTAGRVAAAVIIAIWVGIALFAAVITLRLLRK
jgi:uncharacterized membrane protein YkvA (DUF1232 family)